jgi:hypothetical protein
VGGEKIPIWYFFSEKNCTIKKRIPIRKNHRGPKNMNRSKYRIRRSLIFNETCGFNSKIKIRMK